MAPECISIIVPALDEAEQIVATLTPLREPGVAELLVVDGGSHDGTVHLAESFADRVLTSPRGRAVQMNFGAAAAQGSILLFLHADTRLPAGFAGAVLAAIAAGAVGGRFDAKLDGNHPLLRLVEAGMNLRSRWSGISTGDQAIFVRRTVFEQMGGFPSIPLMEDVAFTRDLKRRGPLCALRLKATTSARRWEKRGVVRTIFLMYALRFAFAAGVPAAILARVYSKVR